MTQAEMLKAIQKSIDQLSNRVDTLSDTTADLAKKTTESRIDVAKLEEKLSACIATLDRITKKIESGNGYSTKMIRTETDLVNLSQALADCQKRCAGKWKLAIILTAAAVTPILVYVVQQVISSVLK